jgi:hypothetical protein
MYKFWRLLCGLFLRRRCKVTLTNGHTHKWVRPKPYSVDDYRATFQGWLAVVEKKPLKLGDSKGWIVVSSQEIVSVEIR